MEDELSRTFAALADPTRRAILARLATGEATVNELAEPFEITLQAVSKHLKVLERAGLISRGKEAQWRPCRFESAPLETATAWIDQHRMVWTERFDKLDAHLAELMAKQAAVTTATPPTTPTTPLTKRTTKEQRP